MGAHKKDDRHHNRLRDVFVTSEDPFFEEVRDPDRKLPVEREKHYADNVPAALRRTGPDVKIKRGKVALGTAIDFLTKRKERGVSYTPQDIAAEHNLNPDTVTHVVKHFRVYAMHEPPAKKDMNKVDPLEAGEDWVVYNRKEKEKEETRRHLTKGEIERVREEERKVAGHKEKTKKLDGKS